MVSIVTKKIKGIEYLYLVDSVREKNRVIQKTIKYIGKKKPITKAEFECMKSSYKEEDLVLKEFKEELSYQDHNLMKKASDTYKEYLQTLDEVSREKEKEKFLSIFIASSNAIEGSTLTVKETYNFLFGDVIPEKHNKKELFMASNLLSAWNYLENIHKQKISNVHLSNLHKLVNFDIESEETLGKYKKVQNYIADIYTSSYLFVEERMETLLKWIKDAKHKMNEFEISFQSHAQFEIIHPFVDGNGRVGRLLINWILMQNDLMPLAIDSKNRSKYIAALDNSRRGKIEAICKFCFNEYIEQYKFIE